MSALRSLRSITNLWDSSKPRDDQNATTLNLQSDQSTGTVKRHRLHKSSQQTRSKTNLLNASINTQSASTLRTEHPDHPLTELRHRLARKASTFSLRNRRRQGEREQAEEAKEKEKLRELVLLGSDKGSTQSEQEEHAHHFPHSDQVPKGLGKAAKPQECQTSERQFSRQSSVTTVRVWDPTSDLLVKDLPPVPPISDQPATLLPLTELIRKNQEAYITKNIAGGKIAVKRMASEQAVPPVPYTRLKEITEHACETALSGVTSYSHSDTEKWNTTIINSILGALVEETAQKPDDGSSAPAQPQFKYVVNSTIIQHSASSSSSPGEESKKMSGRRGMHAASGAYWNNEKDGMWSFKYPGADSKGLDVVVGIIWVWVG